MLWRPLARFGRLIMLAGLIAATAPLPHDADGALTTVGYVALAVSEHRCARTGGRSAFAQGGVEAAHASREVEGGEGPDGLRPPRPQSSWHAVLDQLTSGLYDTVEVVDPYAIKSDPVFRQRHKAAHLHEAMPPAVHTQRPAEARVTT